MRRACRAGQPARPVLATAGAQAALARTQQLLGLLLHGQAVAVPAEAPAHVVPGLARVPRHNVLRGTCMRSREWCCCVHLQQVALRRLCACRTLMVPASRWP